jgi:hypothetical protein
VESRGRPDNTLSWTSFVAEPKPSGNRLMDLLKSGCTRTPGANESVVAARKSHERPIVRRVALLR